MKKKIFFNLMALIVCLFVVVIFLEIIGWALYAYDPSLFKNYAILDHYVIKFLESPMRLKSDLSFLQKSNISTLHSEEGGGGEEFMFDAPSPSQEEQARGLHRKLRAVCRKADQTVYDVIYGFDRSGRRFTDNSEKRIKNKHIAFFGCSRIFGSGVSDDSTLPSQFKKNIQSANIYNLAVRGGSIANAIHDLQYSSRWDGMSPQKGILIINFDANIHLVRFLLTMRNVGSWNTEGVKVVFNKEKGIYESVGFIHEIAPIFTKFSIIMAKSKFLKLIRFDWPYIQSKHFRDYAFAIKNVCDKYKTIYGNKCIVFFQPRSRSSRLIIPHLESFKIPFLDYSDFDIHKYSKNPLYIPNDGHPTENYNFILAKVIASDLSLPENQHIFSLEESVDKR